MAVTFLLKSAPPLGADLTKRSPRDLLSQIARMDFIGATLIAAAVVSMVLALQWGGNTKPWGDKAVIISFVFAGVSTIAFICWEKFLGDAAMTPLKIFKSRSMYVFLVMVSFPNADRGLVFRYAIIFYCFLTRFSLLLFSYVSDHLKKLNVIR